eukprot:CAMPEP_0198200232 /NCGR_PEP_ID=MMETSP1445-20131203/3285_1 /TAXON_ID=36898 /ORGANISM="Pyramimonas sp., Strain CCMP2087" /LENGTH=520 /DNA_ID=CAMNT_0043870229 /DNA_START=148 /DNA_END=1706 /DNA_ORIENTATION=-
MAVENESRGSALLEAQLIASRERCTALADENTRMASLCNELVFRCVLKGVDVPKNGKKTAAILNALSFSVTAPLHKGICCMRHGNIVRTNASAVYPSRTVVNDSNLDLLCSPEASFCLESLSLSGSRITDSGIARNLKGLRGIRELDISECAGVSDEIAHTLELGMPQLESLDISYTKITNEGLGLLSMLPKLKVLRCRGCHAITDFGLTALGGKDTIIVVDFAETGVTDKSVCRIDQDLPSLECAGFSGCAIGDGSVEALSRIKGLKCVDLSKCFAVTAKGAQHLQALTGLQQLDLSHTQVNATSLGWLAFAPHLLRLCLNHTGREQVGDLGMGPSFVNIRSPVVPHPLPEVGESSPRKGGNRAPPSSSPQLRGSSLKPLMEERTPPSLDPQMAVRTPTLPPSRSCLPPVHQHPSQQQYQHTPQHQHPHQHPHQQPYHPTPQSEHPHQQPPQQQYQHPPQHQNPHQHPHQYPPQHPPQQHYQYTPQQQQQQQQYQQQQPMEEAEYAEFYKTPPPRMKPP